MKFCEAFSRAERLALWLGSLLILSSGLCFLLEERVNPRPNSSRVSEIRATQKGPRPTSQIGKASWYGERFAGLPTANGERFDPKDWTAAHRTLPLGTYARVTNLQNGRSVIVRINDRGPYVEGRLIDLSQRTAWFLGMEQQGIGHVEIEVVQYPWKRRRDS